MGVTLNTGQLSDVITFSNGNIGIGGSPSGSYKLDVTGTGRFTGALTSAAFTSTGLSTFIRSTSTLYINPSYGGSDVYSQIQSTVALAFAAGGDSNKMYITSTGNVGIGTNNPTFPLHIYYPTGAAANALVHIQGTTNYSGFFAKNTGGELYFAIDNSTGTGFGNGGYSRLIYSNGNYPLDFYTYDNLRMRITSGGNVIIGSTTDPSVKFQAVQTTSGEWAGDFKNYSSGAYGLRVDLSGSTGTASNSAFQVYTQTGGGFRVRNDGMIFMPQVYNNTSGGSGTVAISASGELYRATSSLKYKENVTDYNKGLNEILQLRPVYYNVKREDDNNLYAGLIAEEIEDLGLKEFVQYAEDGTPDAIYYANMIALLTKAIQEQNQLISELSAKVSALENKS